MEPVKPSPVRDDRVLELRHEVTPEPSELQKRLDFISEQLHVFNMEMIDTRKAVGSIRIPEPKGESTLNVILSAFGGLGYALSARALLLLALLGAFALAVLAMESQTTMGLLILAAYSLSTVVPVTVLEIRKTRE